jgi:hypothetical protein
MAAAGRRGGRDGPHRLYARYGVARAGAGVGGAPADARPAEGPDRGRQRRQVRRDRVALDRRQRDDLLLPHRLHDGARGQPHAREVPVVAVEHRDLDAAHRGLLRRRAADEQPESTA